MADFVTLNGYNVKDKKAREDIEKLKEEILFIYPLYNNAGTSQADTNGDCTIVKTKNNTVMLDTFLNENNWLSIVNTCNKYNITKFDYVIISHYHIDHYGNLQRLLQDFDCTNTKFYIPRNVANSYVDTTAQYNFVITLLNNYEYYIIDNDVITIDDLKISLFNGSLTDYATIESSQTTDYNNYSIITLFEYKNNKVLSLADVGEIGQKNIYDKGYLKTSDYSIVKSAHHSYQGAYIPLVDTINVTNVIEETTLQMFYGIVNGSDAMRLSMLLQDKCKAFYVIGYQNEELVFRVGNTTELITLGISNLNSYNFLGWGNINLYVDYNNAGLFRNGTQEYPFKYVNEAIFFINKQLNAEYRVIVLSSDPQEDIKIYNISIAKNIDLDFRNNTVKKISIYNCQTFVTLRNVIIDNNARGLDVNNVAVLWASNLTLNCNGVADFVYLSYTKADFYGSININNSGGTDVFKLLQADICFEALTVNTTGTLSNYFMVSNYSTCLFHDTAYANITAKYPNIIDNTSKKYTLSNKWTNS